MILYNVTVSIDESIHQDWMQWMREVHIPEVLATGCFLESRLSRILAEEEGGVSFSIMYLCPNQEIYDEYQQKHAPRLQADHNQKYGGKFAAFRTVLNIIEEFKHVG